MKVLQFILFALSGVLLLLVLCPVPAATTDNMECVQGRFSDVLSDDATGDIVLHIEDVSTRYYINRGSMRGVSVDHLQQEIGRRIRICYVQSVFQKLFGLTSPLHAVQVHIESEEFYSELK